jgi:spoIIIJ-associated protein
VSTRKYTVEEAGPRIDAFLKTVLKDASLDLRYDITKGGNVHADFENPEIVVKFKGPDVDFLLSNKAELMLALEQLTMEALRMSAEEHSQLQFDANDYRMLRIEELRLSALTVAEKVKKSRMPFEFNPMNSRERRIVHLALRNEPEVRSESIGIGPNRQVVVYPAGMPSLPAPSRPPQQPFRRGGGGGGPRGRR